MSLRAFLNELEQQWAELTEGLWADDAAGRLHDRVRRLEQALPRRYERLARLRAVIEAMRDRLAEQEKRLKNLAERVEMYLHVADRENSWKHALELDRTRRAIEHESGELRECERIYSGQVAEIEQLKRRLAQLRENLYLQEHRRA